MTYNNKLYVYGSIVLIQILSFSLVNRFPIPYELYYYITKVDQTLLTDPLTYAFQLLKTPSYYLLEPFYNKPTLFFWTSFFVDLVFAICLFYLIFKTCKNYLISLVIFIIFSPLCLAIFSKIFFDPGFRVIHVFGYGSYIFSTRYILGFLTLFSIFFLIRKNFNLSLIFYSLSLMAHPSSALLTGLFLFSTIVIIKLKFKYIINFFIASFIGLTPTLLKLLKLKNFNIQTDLLSKKEWYLRLIHDEPDDFSLLYKLSETSYEVIFITLVVLVLTYLIFKKSNIDLLTKKILVCSICFPVFYFFVFLVIEYGSIYFDNFALIDPMIKSQAGYKILKFCYFPLVMSCAFLLSGNQFVLKYNQKVNIFSKSLFIFFITIISLVFLLNPSNLKNKKILLSKLKDVKKNNYLDYLNARFFYYENRTFGHEQYFLKIPEEKPSIIQNELNYFKLKKYSKKLKNIPEVIDKNSLKYNSVKVYNHLVSIIEKNIPEKSNIIILPYPLYLRDVLPRYNFFYLEKPDANLSLGSRLTASIISERLKDLIDVDHKVLHLNFSPFLNSDLRSRYLDIDDDKIDYLIKKYPNYKYFVTENDHKLNRIKIFKDSLYTIYKIN